MNYFQMNYGVDIQKRICLPYQFLDSSLKDHIINHIQDSLGDECSKEYGYILSIKDDFKIIDHEISRLRNDLIFLVSFKADTLKPESGDEVEGDVCMIFSDGIFVNIQDKLKILVPSSNLVDYEYNHDNDTFEKKGGKNIKVGDIITVVVQASMYNKNKISCFASLKE